MFNSINLVYFIWLFYFLFQAGSSQWHVVVFLCFVYCYYYYFDFVTRSIPLCTFNTFSLCVERNLPG